MQVFDPTGFLSHDDNESNNTGIKEAKFARPEFLKITTMKEM